MLRCEGGEALRVDGGGLRDRPAAVFDGQVPQTLDTAGARHTALHCVVATETLGALADASADSGREVRTDGTHKRDIRCTIGPAPPGSGQRSDTAGDRKAAPV
ncbi:hypothetical protein TPA0905_31680 [Streptomyces olivaceus]|nr:hypothetical protein TPA0905_31680 [Streptomyces olivaceus]